MVDLKIVPRTDRLFVLDYKEFGKQVPTLSRRRCDRIIQSREFGKLVAYLWYKPCLFSILKDRPQLQGDPDCLIKTYLTASPKGFV